MREDSERNLIRESGGKPLVYLCAGLAAILLLVFVLLQVYLATPLPARQLSRFVSSTLKQEFSVKSVGLSGKTLVLTGVRLHNPKGFAGPDLVTAGSVAIKPKWLDLLRGRRNYELVSIDGGRINLMKNAAGAWNFSDIQRALAARPRAAKPPETVIGKLVLQNSSFTVQGEGVRGVNLKLYNLTSGGSRNAQIELAFEDAARNHYQLQGTARPGGEAAVDLTLSAPILYLQKLAGLLKLKNPGPLEKARGSLTVNAVLAKGELRSSGIFRFMDVLLPAANGSYPVAGTVQFNGYYNIAEDRADLSDATLEIAKVAQLHVEGSLTGVRKERRYALLFGVDQVDLALLNVLLADEARRGLVLGGKLRCESLRIEGAGATGVESVAGILLLTEGAVARNRELLVAGVTGKVALSRKGSDINAAGTLSSSPDDGKAVVEALRLPFDLTLSPRLKPLRAHSSGFSARAYGLPMSGDLSCDQARTEPLAASLKLSDAKLAALNPFLKRHNLQASAGSASGTVALSGKSGREFKATGRVTVSGFTGTRGKEPVGIKDGVVSGTLVQQGEHRQGTGEGRLLGLSFGARAGDARFGFRIDDQGYLLNEVQARLGTTRFSAVKVAGRFPAASAPGTTAPLALELEGGTLTQGDMELAGLSGRFDGNIATAGEERWLEGSANLSARAGTVQGTPVGAPVLRATFNKAGGRAELSGRLVGGTLSGQAGFRPFSPQSPMTFQLALQDASALQVAKFLPKTATTRPTAGRLDLRASGSHAGKGGWGCRFDIKGRGLAFTKNGRNALSGASLFFSGSYSGDTLSIGEGLFSPGKGVALRARGQVAQVTSPKRQGSIAISLPETPAEVLVDATVNLMPQALQEATLKGAVSANGKLEFRQGRQLLEGGVEIRGGSVQSAPQKLAVTDINGRIPVSLDLSGKSTAQPKESREFSRGNYPRLLSQLRGLQQTGDVLSVGRASFGSLELGQLTLQLHASQGLMELTSLRTSLYEGTILGTGYLAMREQPTYRADLLVNGVSLKKLCRSIPGVQGYISGRVDGVISFKAVGAGPAGTTGFVDLWAREGGGEKMLVSKEFLQRLAKQKLSGFFLSSDRPYDQAEIKATLQEGDLSFNTLKIVNTNLFGVKDLNVNIAPTQNRIALTHLLESIKEAAVRGTPATGQPSTKQAPAQPEAVPEFKWEE